MAEWTYPASDTITGATKIKDADDKIQSAMNDLNDWINNTGDYSGGSGATYGSIADATDTDIATPTNEDGLRYNSTTSKYENVPVYSKADTNTLLSGKQVAGTYNTVIGTDTDINTMMNQVIGTLVLTDGVVESHSTRTLGVADLGINATTTELNYVDGVTSNIQTQLNGKQVSGTYNTTIGTSTDVSTSGSTIIDSIAVTNGVITSMGTREIVASDISGIVGVGIDQSWTDVKASRVSGTTYINTTGKPIHVSIQCVSSGSNFYTVSLVVGGVTLTNYDENYVSYYRSFIVPNGDSYTFTSELGIGYWAELR